MSSNASVLFYDGQLVGVGVPAARHRTVAFHGTKPVLVAIDQTDINLAPSDPASP